MADSNEVFPLPLVPAIRKALFPSIKNQRSPAANGVKVLYLIRRGKVHGLSLCLLIDKP